MNFLFVSSRASSKVFLALLETTVRVRRKGTEGTADKILDFFLRRKRVLAKYTKEEKKMAIYLYIRYCKQATMVSRNLDILMSGTHWSAGSGI